MPVLKCTSAIAIAALALLLVSGCSTLGAQQGYLSDYEASTTSEGNGLLAFTGEVHAAQ
jgi:uncharacterized lipoprotein